MLCEIFWFKKIIYGLISPLEGENWNLKINIYIFHFCATQVQNDSTGFYFEKFLLLKWVSSEPEGCGSWWWDCCKQKKAPSVTHQSCYCWATYGNILFFYLLVVAIGVFHSPVVFGKFHRKDDAGNKEHQAPAQTEPERILKMRGKKIVGKRS